MVSSPFITSPLYDPKQHDQVTMNLPHYLFPAQLLLDIIVGTEGTSALIGRSNSQTLAAPVVFLSCVAFCWLKKVKLS